MIKHLIAKLVAIGKVKLISGGIVALLAVGGITGIIMYNQNKDIDNSSVLATDETTKTNAERIADLKDAYIKADMEMESIINIGDVYEPMRSDLNEIGVLIDSLTEESNDNDITNAEDRIKSMLGGLDDYMKQSLTILLQKEDQLNGIDISTIPDNSKIDIDSKKAEYSSLKDVQNYKEANNKIDELLILANNEVAKVTSNTSTSTSTTSEEATSGNSSSSSSNNSGTSSSTGSGSSSKSDTGKSSSNDNNAGPGNSNVTPEPPSPQDNNLVPDQSQPNQPVNKPSYQTLSWTSYNGYIGFYVSSETDPYTVLEYTNACAAEHPEILNMQMTSIDVGYGYVFEGWK